MTKPSKKCRDCENFSPNPYNARVGACMDSAHDGVYEQVNAEQLACSVGLGFDADSIPTRKRWCPGCGTMAEEDEFIRDPASPDGLSTLCYICSNLGVTRG